MPFWVVEEGDGIARVEADVSRRLNSYNSVSALLL